MARLARAGVRSRGRGTQLAAAVLAAMVAAGGYGSAWAGEAVPLVVVGPDGSDFAVVVPAPEVEATARQFLNTDAMSNFERDALVARELDEFFATPTPKTRHPRCREALRQYPIGAVRKAFRDHLKRLWFTELAATGAEPGEAGASAAPLFHRWLERWCDMTPRRNV